MRCNECKTSVEGKTDSCPLCGTPMQNNGEALFAPTKKRAGRYNLPFSLIYISLALTLTVLCAVVNAFVRPDLCWWGAVAISCAFVYFFIRHTLFGHRNPASKIAYLTVAVLPLAVSIFEIFDFPLGYSLVLPILLNLLCDIGGVYMATHFKHSKAYLLSPFVQGLLSTIPLWICLGFGLEPLVAALAGAIGLALCTVIAAFGHKELLNELKRFFAS